MTPTDDSKPRKIIFDWFDPSDYEKSRQKDEKQIKAFFKKIADMYFHGKSCNHLRVFEPGCGTGRLLKLWQELGVEVSGCDSSEKMISYCKNRNKIENVYCQDVISYSPEEKVDLVYSLLFLHLNEDWIDIIKHCFKNILKEDGKLILLYEESPYFSLVTGHSTRFFDAEASDVSHPIVVFFNVLNKYLNEKGLEILSRSYPGPYMPSKMILPLKSEGYSIRFIPYQVKWDVNYSIEILKRDLREHLMSPYKTLTTKHMAQLFEILGKNKDLNADIRWVLPHILYAWCVQRNSNLGMLSSSPSTESDYICSPVNIREEMEVVSKKDLENVIEKNMAEILSKNSKLLYCSLSYFMTADNKRYLGIWSRIPETEIAEWWESAKSIKDYVSLTSLLALKGQVSPFSIHVYVRNNNIYGFYDGQEVDIKDLFIKLGADNKSNLDLCKDKIRDLYNLISILTGYRIDNIYGYGFTLPLHFHNPASERTEELASCFLLSSEPLSDGNVSQIAVCLTAIFMKKYISPTGITGFPYIVSTISSINAFTIEDAQTIRDTIFSGNMHNWDKLNNIEHAQRVMVLAKDNPKLSRLYEFKEILQIDDVIMQALLLKAMSRRPLWSEKSEKKWHPLEWLYSIDKKLSLDLKGSPSFQEFKKAIIDKNRDKLSGLLKTWDSKGRHDASRRLKATELFKGIEMIYAECKGQDLNYTFYLTENDKRLWLIIKEESKKLLDWKDSFIRALSLENPDSLGGDFKNLRDCLRYGNPIITRSKKIFDTLTKQKENLSDFSVVVLANDSPKQITFAILLYY